MPPPGIPIPPEIKTELVQGAAELGKQIENLGVSLKDQPELLALLPDIQIFHNAVRYALEDELFYRSEDFGAARKLLAEGRERAGSLRDGRAPWTSATGLVVRGYRSKLDGSVQPYGLIVPETYQAGSNRKHRLDLWFHGRNNKLSELSFLTERESNRGEFAPTNAFVLHPYGRYCNAFKFAGEVDVFEALESVRKQYPIDENRIAARGFSMGGAATWHLAAHYASRWAVASPGAGFVDTYIFQNGPRWTNQPPWYEQRLWHLYDVTDSAVNLFNCPVVAYSGEIDPQRQAAELMSRAMAAEGIDLVHIIGPGTAHRFEPSAKTEVARRVDAWVEQGRNPMPRRVRFATWTLRYNQMAWVTVDALERHWTEARVEAELKGGDQIQVSTINVTGLTLAMPAGLCPLDSSHRPSVILDNQSLAGPPVTQGSWTGHFEKKGGLWRLLALLDSGSLRKRHGLQGPIDDAFMDSFIMVRPTGRPMNHTIGDWTRTAMEQALSEWRLQFRGEPRVVDDTAISTTDMAQNNLVLWGDPRSNHLLGRLKDRLPLRWDSGGVRLAGHVYANHIPVLIYPNPLSPNHYIVINSGFTFADAAPTSNALQIPELPDYAVVNPETNRVVEAGFFDEDWKLRGGR